MITIQPFLLVSFFGQCTQFLTGLLEIDLYIDYNWSMRIGIFCWLQRSFIAPMQFLEYNHIKTIFIQNRVCYFKQSIQYVHYSLSSVIIFNEAHVLKGNIQNIILYNLYYDSSFATCWCLQTFAVIIQLEIRLDDLNMANGVKNKSCLIARVCYKVKGRCCNSSSHSIVSEANKSHISIGMWNSNDCLKICAFSVWWLVFIILSQLNWFVWHVTLIRPLKCLVVKQYPKQKHIFCGHRKSWRTKTWKVELN